MVATFSALRKRCVNSQVPQERAAHIRGNQRTLHLLLSGAQGTPPRTNFSVYLLFWGQVSLPSPWAGGEGLQSPVCYGATVLPGISVPTLYLLWARGLVSCS